MEADATKQQDELSEGKNTFMCLPQELLLQIASQLCGSGALPKLACVNKTLYGITKQALARNLVIHECDLNLAIEWLLQNRALIASVNSVSLSAPRVDHRPGCISATRKGFETELKEMLSESIAESTNGNLAWQELQSSTNDPNPRLEDDNHQHLIDALLCICPNIHTVTIQTQAEKLCGFAADLPYHDRFFRLPVANRFAGPIAPISGVSSQQVRAKLKSLTIEAHHAWAGIMKEEVLTTSTTVYFQSLGRDLITFTGFDQLQHLDIPMESLGLPYNTMFRDAGDYSSEIVSVPKELVFQSVNNIKFVELSVKVLPLSLVWLQFRSCNKYLFQFLELIRRIPAHHRRLKRIDLHLDTGARESINQWLLACHESSNFPLHLSELEGSGVEATFYTETGARIIDMSRELLQHEVMSELALSGEEYLLALTRKQFSDLNVGAVESRRKSRRAHQLFMRHGLAHFDLFNSPSFDSNCWQEAAFFRGTSNTKYDPCLRPTTDSSVPKKSSTIISHRGQWRRQLNLDRFEFDFAFSKMASTSSSVEKVVSFLGTNFVLGPSPFDKTQEQLNETPGRGEQVSDEEVH
ncbi:hypothetical protein DE146DRAFT_784996 [Phaeosphaeria sp. MPI-PUGE-AT-0046c]|nr:hypothetical protein DE146DRAFT_784996 [Phaeosphaeria sp. MPI-PUGE-AT-0046c]